MLIMSREGHTRSKFSENWSHAWSVWPPTTEVGWIFCMGFVHSGVGVIGDGCRWRQRTKCKVGHWSSYSWQIILIPFFTIIYTSQGCAISSSSSTLHITNHPIVSQQGTVQHSSQISFLTTTKDTRYSAQNSTSQLLRTWLVFKEGKYFCCNNNCPVTMFQLNKLRGLETFTQVCI